jgi:hypothetical protein
MPQGTWFGQYVFLIQINDLRTIINYFYTFTLTEVVIKQPANTQTQLAKNQVAEWSQLNINTKKDKINGFSSSFVESTITICLSLTKVQLNV